MLYFGSIAGLVISLAFLSTSIHIFQTSEAQVNATLTAYENPKFGLTLSYPCSPLSTESVNLGGKIAQATVTPCNMEASPTKTRNYNIDLGGGKTISFVFVSNPSMYDAALPKFEEIVKTVIFTK